MTVRALAWQYPSSGTEARRRTGAETKGRPVVAVKREDSNGRQLLLSTPGPARMTRRAPAGGTRNPAWRLPVISWERSLGSAYSFSSLACCAMARLTHSDRLMLGPPPWMLFRLAMAAASRASSRSRVAMRRVMLVVSSVVIRAGMGVRPADARVHAPQTYRARSVCARSTPTAGVHAKQTLRAQTARDIL